MNQPRENPMADKAIENFGLDQGWHYQKQTDQGKLMRRSWTKSSNIRSSVIPSGGMFPYVQTLQRVAVTLGRGCPRWTRSGIP